MDELTFRRFASMVAPPNENGCMVWLRATSHNGYGRFWIGDKEHRAAKLSYEHFVGPLPKGHIPHHRCFNPPCVAPYHLEPKTQWENQVLTRRARVYRDVPYHLQGGACRHGHKYTEENTYITPSGYRQCRICKRTAGRKCREHGEFNPRNLELLSAEDQNRINKLFKEQQV
jgi:hypothetical protein